MFWLMEESYEKFFYVHFTFIYDIIRKNTAGQGNIYASGFLLE